MGLNVEINTTVEPPEVRLTGNLDQLELMGDGLRFYAAGALIAEAAIQPFPDSPDVAQAAERIWSRHAASALGEHTYMRVPLDVGVMATRGVQMAYGHLVQERIAAAEVGTSSKRDREVAFCHLLGELGALRQIIAERDAAAKA